MPPKKAVAALAQSVKQRVSRKSATKTTTTSTSSSTAPSKTRATSKKATNTKSGAITADNNPAAGTKKKPVAKSAGKAPSLRANMSRKRKATEDEDDEDENESEAPAPKKAKTAPKEKPAATKTKSVAAKKSTSTTTASKTKAAAAKKPAVKKSAIKKSTATKKRKSADVDDEDESENEGPVAKKTKTASKKTSTAPKKPAQKRKSADDGKENDAPVAKKAKVTGEKTVKAAPKKKATPTPKVKIGVQINFAPTQVLDVYVFGEGSAGELGLGATKVDGKKPIDVKRPRKNVNLSAELVGVVQVACGGMHAIALTKDNKILTWGVNDQGTLGRDTQWDGGLRNVDVAEEDSDSDSDDSGLNPRESTPTEVNTKNIAPGTKFVQVAATDSASFALTEDGRVYSWGTFRCSDGILGFSKDTKIQWYPALLPEPTKVVAIATGSNHVMTLDNKGKIQTWGAAEQNQLGRRVVERDMKASALRPAGLNFKRGVKITKIACGSYHSFAIDGEGRVWAWGLNNFSQLGVEADAGEDDATLLQPTLVEALAGHVVTGIVGGEHHSVAVTEDGKALAFGRIDGSQVGVPRDAFSQENCVYDGCGQPRILVVPAVLDIPGAVVCADAGTDTSLVVTREGKAYSWGFNSNYQCGVGETAGDVLVPTLINNSAVRDSSVVWAGAGGQFSMLASVHEDAA